MDRRQYFRIGYAGIRVALIIERRQLQLETHSGQGAAELLHAQVRAILNIAADHGHIA